MTKPPYRVPSMAEIAAVPDSGLTVASFFAGCGGSCLGYRMAGFRLVYANEFLPEARACHALNFPGVALDHRDIRDVRPEDVLAACGMAEGELDLMDGSPPCFPTGTPIVSSRGEIPIEEVGVGDLVLTHAGKWRRATRTMRRRVSGLVEVDAKYSPEPFRCTADHPLYVRRRQVVYRKRTRTTGGGGAARRVYGDPEWVRAGDLRPGDALLRPFARESLPIPCPSVRVLGWSGRRDATIRHATSRPCSVDLRSEAVAWALGLYLAEGHLVWRKFIDGAIPPQSGVCCSVFRREEGAAGPRASEMILAAEPFARRRWPREIRFYTYVDPSKVRAKRDPGRCFLRAGWRYQRDADGVKVRTMGGLTILEKETQPWPTA